MPFEKPFLNIANHPHALMINLNLGEWNEENLQAIKEKIEKYIKEHADCDENKKFMMQISAEGQIAVYEQIEKMEGGSSLSFSGYPNNDEVCEINCKTNILALIGKRINEFSSMQSSNNIKEEKMETNQKKKGDEVQTHKGLVYMHEVKDLSSIYPSVVTAHELGKKNKKDRFVKTVFLNQDGRFCFLNTEGKRRDLHHIFNVENILFATFPKEGKYIIPSFYFINPHNHKDTIRFRMHHECNTLYGPAVQWMGNRVFNIQIFFDSSEEGKKFLNKILNLKDIILCGLDEDNILAAEKAFRGRVLKLVGDNQQELRKEGAFVCEVGLVKNPPEDETTYSLNVHPGSFAKPVGPEDLNAFLETLVALAPVLVSDGEKLSPEEIAAIRKETLENISI